MSDCRIVCLGDVMCGDSFYTIGHGVDSAISKYSRNFIQPAIVDYIKSHNVALCNVECALSNIGRRENILRTIHMRGRPQTAKYIADWGIEVASVANNHIMEHGYDAAVDTVKSLQKAGIQVAGAGKDGVFLPGVQVAEVPLNDQIVSVLGICLLKEKYAYDGGIDLDELLRMVKHLSSQGRTVVVSIHWGDELMDRPNIHQRKIGRSIIDAGASLVAGHHPHVVQGVERYGKGLIAYSLGNFVFDCFLEDTSWSMALSITMSGGDVVDWSYVPLVKDKEHRPLFATGDRKTSLDAEIRRRCDLLASESSYDRSQESYETDFSSRDLKLRRNQYVWLLKNVLRIKPVYWPQILWRPIQRRTKIW
ncbi:MAG: CapA family protein [Sedimentisphaerales bacterium]